MPSHLTAALRLGLAGARANFLPAVVLWMIGFVLVFGYYRASAFAEVLDQFGRFKEEHRPWVAMVSTAIFGGLFPWLLQLFLVRDPAARIPARRVLPMVFFWAVHGWQVDWLYRLQAQFFGDNNDFWTVVKKTAVDEFVWVPFLAIPQVVLFYLFIEKDLSPTAFREALRRKPYLDRAIPTMIANWVVWIPAVSMVYLLPFPLQLPLMNLILAFWSAILIFFAKAE